MFAEWAEKQVGWATENYELDKDILVKDNKVYCRETVVFVPESLNTFFTNRMASRGRYPQGIHERKDRGVLASYVGYRGGREFVGHFTNVADAMVAFARAKTAAGRRWGDALRSGEFIVDERVIVAMENYKFEYNEE